jgi:LmbE family N-acetylglucosaminyl deacetylase
MKKLLFIGAHPDDETLCTGTFLKAGTIGFETHILICSEGKNGKPNNHERTLAKENIIENRSEELEKYAKNINATSYHILNTPNQLLTEDILILDILKQLRDIRPDIVITHMDNDYHYDHQVVHDAVKNAFEIAHRSSFLELGPKLTGSILLAIDGLEMINNPDFYIDISSLLETKTTIIKDSYGERLGKLIDMDIAKSTMRGARKGISAAECLSFIKVRSVTYSSNSLKLLSELIA